MKVKIKEKKVKEDTRIVERDYEDLENYFKKQLKKGVNSMYVKNSLKENVNKEDLINKHISYVSLYEEGYADNTSGPSNIKYDGSSVITNVNSGKLIIDDNRMQPLNFERVNNIYDSGDIIYGFIIGDDILKIFPQMKKQMISNLSETLNELKTKISGVKKSNYKNKNI